MSGRSELLLGGLTRADPIIELGPSFAPVAPKRAGWAAVVVDHADRAALVAKYAGHPNVDPDRIEAVDRIWTGGPIDELFSPAEHGRFRALIASHVFEHLPDPIGFLGAAARLLDPEAGVLALAIPDKRWCFDVLKPPSTTGQILAARGATRHGRATLFDHTAYYATDGRPSWGREPLPGLRLAAPLEDARRLFEAGGDAQAPYVDAHAWHFTPAGFELAILELGALGEIDWRVDWIAPQPAVEFLVHLRRGAARFPGAPAREAARLALLRRMWLELREQTDWLLDTPPALPVDAAARLDRIEARLRRMEEGTLTDLAATAAMTRRALAPAQRVWGLLGPLRRRLRGAG